MHLFLSKNPKTTWVCSTLIGNQKKNERTIYKICFKLAYNPLDLYGWIKITGLHFIRAPTYAAKFFTASNGYFKVYNSHHRGFYGVFDLYQKNFYDWFGSIPDNNRKFYGLYRVGPYRILPKNTMQLWWHNQDFKLEKPSDIQLILPNNQYHSTQFIDDQRKEATTVINIRDAQGSKVPDPDRKVQQ